MKPSKYHRNRQLHNWLIYNIGDRFLIKYSKYIKGHFVDLGSGEAPYKDFFLQFADKYTGVDWSNTLHNSQADVVSDLNKEISLPDEIADTVIALSVMEHLCEPQTFLNEAYRILRPNGYIILQVPFQWWVHEAPYDYFRYTYFGLKHIFQKAGFVDIRIESQSVFFTMLIIKINYFSLRLIRGPKVFKLIIKTALIPIWTVGQLIAPFLDKLDKNWLLETTGYFVIARK